MFAYRLIIDKVSVEEWGGSRGGPHAGKSAGEWSAGESLLMLEDACKNERKHSEHFSKYLNNNLITQVSTAL